MASEWMEEEPRGAHLRWTPLRLLVVVLVVLGLGIGALRWGATHWAPGRDRYPVQGVAISARNGDVQWPMLRRQGADFAYLAATAGSTLRDPAFAANWAGARAAGLRYGAIHAFSLCRPASDQARLFLASVPRDNGALPPVVAMDFEPSCTTRPSRDVVLSELNNFLNEMEAHSGKPAILRVSKAFEEHYTLSSGINRTIWLEGNILVPDYAAHPWVLWTANNWRHLRGADDAVDWTVVRS